MTTFERGRHRLGRVGHDLPFGLDTRIGEQGMSLSGGQRQRLSLARAIVADRRSLVLDDTCRPWTCTHRVRRHRGAPGRVRGVTGVVVAHRTSTVLLADRVALLEPSTERAPPTSAGTPKLATVPRYRYLLAGGDELDDGCPNAVEPGGGQRLAPCAIGGGDGR